MLKKGCKWIIKIPAVMVIEAKCYISGHLVFFLSVWSVKMRGGCGSDFLCCYIPRSPPCSNVTNLASALITLLIEVLLGYLKKRKKQRGCKSEVKCSSLVTLDRSTQWEL